ncbi:hypothetical protein [Methanothrix sp.]|uniref:hypothetical protein n=1 Tax=Methanothrix sp. TaxID=90426 RepID=UPI003BB52012
MAGSEPKKAQKLSDFTKEWVNFGHQLYKESPGKLDEAAKSLMTIGSSLLTVYIGAITLFKINEKLDSNVLIFGPIFFWLLCIAVCVFVYFPGVREMDAFNVDQIKNTLNEIIGNKYTKLRIGAGLFVIALCFSTYTIGTSLWQEPSADIIQFVVAKEQISAFENMTIKFENGSQKTIPLVLTGKKDNLYHIKLNDNTSVLVSGEMIEGVIYKNK